MSSYRRKQLLIQPRRIIIAVEGAKREKQYFDWFQNKVRQGITVTLLPPPQAGDEQTEVQDKGGVKPHELLERLKAYCQNHKNAVDKQDYLWLVFDCDKNDYDKFHMLDELKREFDREDLRAQNRFIAHSNPCFEVWLHLHLAGFDNRQTSLNCKKLKRIVGAFNDNSGFDSTQHISLESVQAAIERARAIDNNDLVPPNPGTRVYHLAEVLLELIKR